MRFEAVIEQMLALPDVVPPKVGRALPAGPEWRNKIFAMLTNVDHGEIAARRRTE